MDLERELIKAENWSELKRLYSNRTGASWELGWLSLLKDQDFEKARDHFALALRDPHYEEAAYILLRKLGKRVATRPPQCPPSFRLFEAYEAGDFHYLDHYLSRHLDHARYFSALISVSVDKLTERDLSLIEKYPRTAATSLALGVHCDRRLKSHTWAEKFYKEYYTNAWSKRVLEELNRHLINTDVSRELKNAYVQHDGISVRRIIKGLAARVSNVSEEVISATWKKSLKQALEWELDHLSENIFSYPFWKHAELSPRAVDLVAKEMFAKEPIEEPRALKFWNNFFSEQAMTSIPVDLDSESLALWQIRVEMEPSLLSEALLKFPTEERFLFLWSLRHREAKDADPRRWPLEERESVVVRKNLERAFDRATNKLIWFDRLRSSGCSQDFYEYVLGRARIPVPWIVEDLERGFLNLTTRIRQTIRDQLATVVPEQDQAYELSSPAFSKALNLLAPAETQDVLLSRYVVSDIPKEILSDEYLDLFWDARNRVSASTFERWKQNMLEYLATKPMHSFQGRHWSWIEAAWETQPDSLDRFSPTVEMRFEFPWSSYLERLEQFEKHDMLLTCLHRIPDERLKETWIHRLLQSSLDHRLFAAINTVHTDFVRYAFLSLWHEKKGDFERALSFREQELETCPIVNDQLEIARSAISLFRRFEGQPSSAAFDAIVKVGRFLELNGGLDAALCRELSVAAFQLQRWDLAWKWAQNEWSRSSEAERANLLEHFLQMAFQARAVEEAQRILVDHIFQSVAPTPLVHEILNQLLIPTSNFRLRHLRREFVNRSTQIFPLHPEVLKSRAEYDYRALLLWDAFYGENLEIRAEPPSSDARRRFELWGLVESATPVEGFSKFGRYVEAVHRAKIEKQSGDLIETARRMMTRLARHFDCGKNLQLQVVKELDAPFRIYLTQPAVVIKESFFTELDEEIWSALCVGILQVLQDFNQGLYEPRRLMERFFHGGFLAGVPVAKLIRLWVWLAVYEDLAGPQILKSDPEKLIETLPFMNSLMIFYLSEDFELKAAACGLLPT